MLLLFFQKRKRVFGQMLTDFECFLVAFFIIFVMVAIPSYLIVSKKNRELAVADAEWEALPEEERMRRPKPSAAAHTHNE